MRPTQHRLALVVLTLLASCGSGGGDSGSVAPEPPQPVAATGRFACTGVEASGEQHLWILDVDGRNARRLTAGPADIDSNPRWSPDRTKILFHRENALLPLGSVECEYDLATETVTAIDGTAGAVSAIYGTSTDVVIAQGPGAFLTRVDRTAQTLQSLPCPLGAEPDDVSPDGAAVLVTAFTPAGALLYTVAADGSGYRPVGGSGFYGRYSDDGSEILYHDAPATGNWQPNSIMNADGSGSRAIATPQAYLSFAMAWSRDDNGFAAVSIAEPQQVFVFDREGHLAWSAPLPVAMTGVQIDW